MKAKTIGEVVVLVFEDTAEAGRHGFNLSAMAEGCRFYAAAPAGTTEKELHRAIATAQEGETGGGDGR